MTRKGMTDIQRAQFFNDKNGTCYLCKRKLRPGEYWQREHPKALCLKGKDTPDNWELVCLTCHPPKTANDLAMKAKADSQAVKHTGVARRRKRVDALARELYGQDGFSTFREAQEEAERRL